MLSNNYCLLLSLLFISALSIPACNSQFSSPPRHSDEEVLLTFKRSLTGNLNDSLFDWSSHNSFCNWTGVVCSSNHQQRVVSLNLSEGGEECGLSSSDRLRIAKEIAQGMEYLHHHCFVQVIHCDLKPTNVLLGDDMTPYIADFGITKLLLENSKNSLTCTSALKGSIGYFAPEYGMGGKISAKGDVYSYGIILLELLTRKRPTNTMFIEGINLPKWASMYFPNKIIEVVDNHLLRDVNELDKETVLACISQFMQVGLMCTRELPQQRPNMVEIVERLEKITSAFLGTPRDFHLPIDISPLLESTSGPKNANSRNTENYTTSTS